MREWWKMDSPRSESSQWETTFGYLLVALGIIIFSSLKPLASYILMVFTLSVSCKAFFETAPCFLAWKILAMIGEQFSESDEICGVVASIRTKQDRVAVWTKTASNEAAQVSIGKELKSILDLPDKQTIGFMAHVSISVLPRPAPVPYA
mmetsp:Transcript_23569/g.56348  ORF Transcript_23569/g.56348 Transcript_23569/m.56348 type:complete len:149 (-) Transcript_23569:97-543(-)